MHHYCDNQVTQGDNQDKKLLFVVFDDSKHIVLYQVGAVGCDDNCCFPHDPWYFHFSLMKYPCAVFVSLWKEHYSSSLSFVPCSMNGMHVTMYPVSVSIFTDQWLIGPTNPLQTSIGKQTWAQGFQHIWSGVLEKFWFQAKRENPWACLVEVISADRWTTWLVFFKQFEL